MPDEIFDLPIDGEEETRGGNDEFGELEKKSIRIARKNKIKRAFIGASKTVGAHKRRAAHKTVARRRVDRDDEYFSQRPRIAIAAATKIPRRVDLYRRLSFGFLGATILVVGVIGFFTFQHATIVVEQTAIPLAATLGVTIGDSVGGVSGGGTNTFIGQVITVTTSTQKFFNPTAVSEKPGKARGNITVYNTGKSAQSLVATTRFLSESGVLFRTTQSITVPAGGNTVVDVTADKSGVAGDIGPSKFMIPGLSAAQQKIVYGISGAPMSGGSGKVGTISQIDIDRAQEEARKALLEIGQQVLVAVKTPNDFEKLYTTINVTANTSAKVGDEVSQFKVVVSGTMALVAYPRAAVYAAADREVQNKAPTQYHRIVFTNDVPVVSLQSLQSDKKTALLQVYREGQAVLDQRSAAFQAAQFLGRTRAEIVDQLKSIQGVKNVSVKLFPFWLKQAPGVSARIDVEIK